MACARAAKVNRVANAQMVNKTYISAFPMETSVLSAYYVIKHKSYHANLHATYK